MLNRQRTLRSHKLLQPAIKLTSSFELNGEYFALYMIGSPLVRPFVYHVHVPSDLTQRSAHHVAPMPIEATIYDDRVELSNVPSRYNDSLGALKYAIKLSLIGE